MPTSVGPNTKGEENLVFGYDLGDVSNSYKGEPTTNVIADPEPLSGWTISNNGTSAATITYSSDNGIPHMELSSVNVDGSYPRIYMANLTSTITDGFSISFEAKSNVSNVQLGLALYSLASTKITQYATLSTEWQRFEFENLTTGFTLDDGYLRVPSTTSGAVYYIRRIQVEQKTHATPYTAGTRSATQGLLDLTGNSTIDLTNVSFDSNAQMTFDGTNDYINLNSIAPLIAGGDFSLEAIIKGPAQDHKGIIPINTSTGGNRALFLIRNASMGIYDGNTWYIGNIDVDDNNWHHVTLSYTRSTRNAVIYVDGEVSLNTTTGNTITVASDDKISVGQEYDGASTSDHFNGQIPIAKIYNRALTASEVQSNYKAVKSRFNI